MKTERWAFCPSELETPAVCNSGDELLCSVTTGPDSSVGVIIYRNGTPSNRYADGVGVVPADLIELAAEEEVFYHPDLDEITDVWANVLVDCDGDWLGWAPKNPA